MTSNTLFDHIDSVLVENDIDVVAEQIIEDDTLEVSIDNSLKLHKIKIFNLSESDFNQLSAWIHYTSTHIEESYKNTINYGIVERVHSSYSHLHLYDVVKHCAMHCNDMNESYFNYEQNDLEHFYKDTFSCTTLKLYGISTFTTSYIIAVLGFMGIKIDLDKKSKTEEQIENFKKIQSNSRPIVMEKINKIINHLSQNDDARHFERDLESSIFTSWVHSFMGVINCLFKDGNLIENNFYVAKNYFKVLLKLNWELDDIDIILLPFSFALHLSTKDNFDKLSHPDVNISNSKTKLYADMNDKILQTSVPRYVIIQGSQKWTSEFDHSVLQLGIWNKDVHLSVFYKYLIYDGFEFVSSEVKFQNDYLINRLSNGETSTDYCDKISRMMVLAFCNLFRDINNRIYCTSFNLSTDGGIDFDSVYKFFVVMIRIINLIKYSMIGVVEDNKSKIHVLYNMLCRKMLEDSGRPFSGKFQLINDDNQYFDCLLLMRIIMTDVYIDFTDDKIQISDISYQGYGLAIVDRNEGPMFMLNRLLYGRFHLNPLTINNIDLDQKILTISKSEVDDGNTVMHLNSKIEIVISSVLKCRVGLLNIVKVNRDISNDLGNGLILDVKRMSIKLMASENEFLDVSSIIRGTECETVFNQLDQNNNEILGTESVYRIIGDPNVKIDKQNFDFYDGYLLFNYDIKIARCLMKIATSDKYAGKRMPTMSSLEINSFIIHDINLPTIPYFFENGDPCCITELHTVIHNQVLDGNVKIFDPILVMWDYVLSLNDTMEKKSKYSINNSKNRINHYLQNDPRVQNLVGDLCKKLFSECMNERNVGAMLGKLINQREAILKEIFPTNSKDVKRSLVNCIKCHYNNNISKVIYTS